MRTSLQLLSSLFIALVIGCGGGTASETDAATGTDSSTAADTGTATDGAAADTGAPATDSGTPTTDSGTPTTDSGTPTTDSGTPGDDAGATCVEAGLGDACGDTAGGAPCPTGFDCDLGRCLPQGRATCGGFVGAPCTDPIRSECVYETGHGDVATCFSPEEVRCLCAIDSTRWCP